MRMKLNKTFHSKNYLNWLKKHLLRNLIRKHKIKNRRRKDPAIDNDIYRNHKFGLNIKNNYRKTLYTPANFSVVDNPNITMQFFQKIEYEILSGNPIKIDMKKVENLTFDSLLYIIAMFDYLKAMNIHFSVRGNLPLNEKFKIIVIESGFLSFFESNLNEIKYNENYLQIKSGDYTNSDIAKHLILFISKHINKSRTELFDLYRIFIEMMANTKQHAYILKNNTPYSKWYLMAKYEKDLKKVKFVFLDTGVGIAKTISKKISEKIFYVFSGAKDSDLIHSALKGEFRSRTEESWRGKGLPNIKKFSAEKYVEDLTIVSNKGYINCTKNNKSELMDALKGTLYSWNLIWE